MQLQQQREQIVKTLITKEQQLTVIQPERIALEKKKEEQLEKNICIRRKKNSSTNRTTAA